MVPEQEPAPNDKANAGQVRPERDEGTQAIPPPPGGSGGKSEPDKP